MQTYVVKPGDTLYGISKQVGVSVNEIKRANNIMNSNNIKIGTILNIPSTNEKNIYIVKAGDTLYKIASINKISVEDLKKENNLQSNDLYIGMKLSIPQKVNNTNKEYIFYEVKLGDNLYTIGKENNISVEELKEINNLKSNILTIGMKIKIPINKAIVGNNYYIVSEGDTLYSIAKKFNITVPTILKLNDLSSTIITVGQKLKVRETKPNGYEIPLGSKCIGKNYVEDKYIKYTVKKDDNLFNIANKFETTVQSIIELNNLKDDNLSIGQILLIERKEQ